MLRIAFLRQRLLFREGRSARGRSGVTAATHSHNGNERRFPFYFLCFTVFAVIMMTIYTRYVTMLLRYRSARANG